MSDVNKRRCERYLDQMGPSGYAPREGRPMDERERVVTLLLDTWSRWGTVPEFRGQRLCEALADAVLPLLADARRQAVEECAALVEGSTEYDTSDSGVNLAIKCGITKALAARIRALLPPRPGQEPSNG